MSRVLGSAFLMTVASALLILAGCGEGEVAEKKEGKGHDDHAEHSEHAETLEGAMKELVAFKATIQSAFEDKKPDDAHDALHEVGHVLEELPELAEKEKMSAEDVKTLKDAVEVLFEGFGELDKGMHGEKGKSYEELSEGIDGAMKTLSGLMSKSE